MSGPGINSSFEVVATTRRRWSPEERQAILSEVSDGVSVSEVARRHGLSRELLFRWRRELRKTAGTSAPEAGERFVRLSLAPPDGCAGRIEIVLVGGRRVLVGSDVDTRLLRRVIEAVEQ